jgi:predicted acyltransferase
MGHEPEKKFRRCFYNGESSFPMPPPRLVSLDAFRGATMALMVLVNTPGTGEFVYPPLRHAEWHGWTITDTVFPSFVWIVGVALTLSLGRRLEAGASRTAIFRQACRRAAILFGLGVLLYAVPKFDPHTFRILGVLQRIAICYLAAVAIFLTTRARGQILWIAGLLVSYWMIIFYAPGAGRLDVDGNFAHYVDQLVLGTHNYEQTKTWDPEGIVSTLPAIATCLFGLLAGRILALKKDLAVRTTWLFVVGNLLLAAGLVLDHWLPINKKLWTDSFTLFMAGLDFVVFAMFLWIADGLGRVRPFRPLVILGMNAIAIYIASEGLDVVLNSIPMAGTTLRVWIYQTLFAPLASPINASLLYAVAYVLLMYAFACLLYRRGWFLRV